MNARHVEVPDRLRTVKRRVPPPVKAVVRSGLRRYAIATASRRTPPDFLVIGAKRAGTTSLWTYLVQHPDVLPMFPGSQQIKSPHYFDINYGRGWDWYLSHFPTSHRRERAERQRGSAVRVGEASPYYMFHPLAHGRVSEDLPHVKVLVLLRNPVDRAYSHYNERVGSGTEPLTSFEAAIEAEEGRLRGEEARILEQPGYYSHHHDNSSYLARGRYLEHLAPWLDAVPEDRRLILVAEDLYGGPAAVFSRVCGFLGIRDRANRTFARHNHLPVGRMSADTRHRLVDYYREHNARLAVALGRTLPWDA